MRLQPADFLLFIGAFLLTVVLLNSLLPNSGDPTSHDAPAHSSAARPSIAAPTPTPSRSEEIDIEPEHRTQDPESLEGFLPIDRFQLAKAHVPLFDAASLTLWTPVIRHYNLDFLQVESINEELGKFFIDLRKIEAAHSEIITQENGETFVRVNKHSDAQGRTLEFVNRITEVFDDKELGRNFGQLLASNSTFGMLGEMIEDVSILPIQGSKAYTVKRIIKQDDESVFHFTQTVLRDTSPVREAYSELFEQEEEVEPLDQLER